jgi:hypothetical protein
MELVHILKSLWRSKALVIAGALLALVAAIVIGARGQTTQGGTASTEIMIDAQQSALGDLRRDVVPLVARGGIFARFLGADGVTNSIASKASVSPDDVAVVGPELSIDGVPDQASAERAIGLEGDAKYLIQVQQGDQLPLLTVFTQAPTEEEARALADATAAALDEHVSDGQVEGAVPEKRRVTIRQLGPAKSAGITEKPGLILPFAVFIVVFGLSCLAILAWPAIKAAWQSEDPSPSSNGKPGSPGLTMPASLSKALQRAHSVLRQPRTTASSRPEKRENAPAAETPAVKDKVVKLKQQVNGLNQRNQSLQEQAGVSRPARPAGAQGAQGTPGSRGEQRMQGREAQAKPDRDRSERVQPEAPASSSERASAG